MNNQNSFNPSGNQTGKFCMLCGAPLDATGNCPNCAKQADPQPTAQPFSYGQPVQPAAPQQPQGFNYGQPTQPAAPQQPQGFNYNQSTQPNAPQQPQGFNYSQPTQPYPFRQQGYQQPFYKTSSASVFFTGVLDYLKSFFSPDPSKALDKAIGEKKPVWSVLGSGSVLLVTLGVFGILLNCINKVYDLINDALSGIPFLGGALGSSLGMDAEFNKIKGTGFLYILLLSIGFFFASAGLNTLFFTLQKKKAGYVQNLNILSVAMLPLAACGAVGFLLSFIYVPISLLLLTAGVMFKYIMLYDGLKKTADFDQNPLWYVFGLIGANIVAFGLIAYILGQFIF